MIFFLKILPFLLFSSFSYSEFDFSGHNKFSSFVIKARDLSSGGLTNQTRLNFSTDTFQLVDFDLGAEVGLLFLSNTELADSISANKGKDYRLFDLPNLDWNKKNGQNFFILFNLDRFSFRKTFTYLDITVGRQALSYGISSSISPITILPKNFGLAFDSEYSRGYDAIKLVVPITEISEIEITNIFTKKSDSNPISMKFKFPVSIVTTEITGIYFFQNMLFGLSNQFSFDTFEFISEISYTLAKEDKQFLRGTWGLQYYFPWEIFTSLEYHYSSLGFHKNNPEYAFAFIDASIYLRNMHYISLSAHKTFETLQSLSLTTLIGPEEKTFLIGGSFEHPGENDLYLEASFNYLLTTEKKSEQIIPNIISFSIKKYF